MSKSGMAAERIPRLLHTEEVCPQPRRSYFSELIQTLFLRDLDPEGRAVQFTSPNSGAGVSFVCSCIATELASQGGRVLLADVKALTILARRAGDEPAKYPERVDSSRLWVLGTKQLMARPVETRTGSPSAATSVLNSLREHFTHIVLDAPALSISDDALSLASAVHGTVIIAQNGVTSKQDIVAARERIVSLGGRVLGSVFNGRTMETREGALA